MTVTNVIFRCLIYADGNVAWNGRRRKMLEFKSSKMKTLNTKENCFLEYSKSKG